MFDCPMLAVDSDAVDSLFAATKRARLLGRGILEHEIQLGLRIDNEYK